MKLSVVIVAKDEAEMLPGALRSAKFADEIVVVVDSESSDPTADVAKKAGAKVHSRQFDSFAGQKNFAIDQATHSWVLILDADERITPELATEIQEVLAGSPSESGYRIPFINFYLGERMRHGGWNDNQLRLVPATARYSGDVHELFDLPGEPGQLQQHIWHFSHRSIRDNLIKTAQYEDIRAAQHVAGDYPQVTRKGLFGAIIREFWHRFIRERGYKDGVAGTIEALYQSFSAFCTLALTWEKQQQPSIPEKYAALDRELEKRA